MMKAKKNQKENSKEFKTTRASFSLEKKNQQIMEGEGVDYVNPSKPPIPSGEQDTSMELPISTERSTESKRDTEKDKIAFPLGSTLTHFQNLKKITEEEKKNQQNRRKPRTSEIRVFS